MRAWSKSLWMVTLGMLSVSTLHAQSYVGQNPDRYHAIDTDALDRLTALYKSGAITFDEYQARLAGLEHPVQALGSDVRTNERSSFTTHSVAQAQPIKGSAPVARAPRPSPTAPVAVSTPTAQVPDQCAAANNGFSLFSVKSDTVSNTTTETCYLRQEKADGSAVVTSYYITAPKANDTNSKDYSLEKGSCGFLNVNLTDPANGPRSAPIDCGAETQVYEKPDGSYTMFTIFSVATKDDLDHAKASLDAFDKTFGNSEVTYAGPANGYYQLNWQGATGAFCGTPAAANLGGNCTAPSKGPILYSIVISRVP